MAPFEALDDAIDFDLLATYLKALANPVRLELLWQLRTPQAAAAVTVRPRRRDEFSSDRAVTRQTVAKHLQKLADVGVVQQLPGSDGAATRWLSNAPQVYALLEELRKITAIPAHELLEWDATAPIPTTDDAAWPPGAKLVLLRGPWEGRWFGLHDGSTWMLGRSRSAHVSLHYDPFISSQHAEIHRSGDDFELRAQPDTRNPTLVNYAPVKPGSSRRLGHGDVVSAGRSILLFHDH